MGSHQNHEEYSMLTDSASNLLCRHETLPLTALGLRDWPDFEGMPRPDGFKLCNASSTDCPTCSGAMSGTRLASVQDCMLPEGT